MPCRSTDPASFPPDFSTDTRFMTAALAELNNSRAAKRLHKVTFAHLTSEEFSEVVQRAQQLKLAEGKNASQAAALDSYDDSGVYYFEFDKLVAAHPFLARVAIGVCRLLGTRKPKQASA